MMTLADASAFFDRTEVLDAFTGAALFYGQVDPYDESKRDAGSAYRRVMSVAPGTPMPAHRSVVIHGQTWLVGAGEVDGHATAHRAKYTLQAASPTQVRTLAQLLAGAAVPQVYSGVEWFKDQKEVEASSQVSAQFLAYLADGTVVEKAQVITCAGRNYLVVGSRPTPSGFMVAVTAQLEYPVTAVSVTGRVFDPVAGSAVDASTVTVQGMRVRWQTLFEYTHQRAERYQEGDDALVLPTATPVVAGTRIELGTEVWQVLDVSSVYGALAAHVRRA